VKEFVLYLNGINGFSLVGAAVLNELQKKGLTPSRIYACGTGALFANDFAAMDGKFEERVMYRFNHLSKSFKLFVNTGESLFSKFTSMYKLATSITSKRIKGMVRERVMLSRLENTSKPQMDVIYSAVNLLKAKEVLITSREWKAGLKASMSVTPIFVPADYRNQKLVSTTSVTGVPGFSTLKEENRVKIFVNTMPLAGRKKPTKTWEIMMRADYLRTITLLEHFSKEFEVVFNFSELPSTMSDFSSDSWAHAKRLAKEAIESSLTL
jgi:predicted acylesterase/phospholipase RssA